MCMCACVCVLFKNMGLRGRNCIWVLSSSEFICIYVCVVHDYIQIYLQNEYVYVCVCVRACVCVCVCGLKLLGLVREKCVCL